MWDRPSFKLSGKSNFQKNYWTVVAVSLLLLIAIGAGGIKINFNFRQNDANRFFNSIFQTPYESSFGYGFENGYQHASDYGNVAFLGMLAGIFAVAWGAILTVSLAVRILVCNPYQVGACRFFMENRYKTHAGFPIVGMGFSANFGNVLLTQFLKDLYTFLWSLLFVIPGIVRSYAYFCVPYILAENPDIDHDRALRLSREMTMGWKGDIFVTDLSFILWQFLNALTIGILGIFYVNPYVYGTKAEIYAFLRGQALERGITTTAELQGFGEGFQAA